MRTLYSTRAQVRGGRDGHARTDDGKLDLALAMPKELGGNGNGTNPEQLFAAGFAACFNSSVRFAARGMHLDAGDVGVEALVDLVADDTGAFNVAVRLNVTIPGLSATDRDRVFAEAKRICAYSNALRGSANVAVALSGTE